MFSPPLLERIYRATVWLLRLLEPPLRWIGFARLEGVFAAGERVSKGALFGCQMCGMCALHSTGMMCPMTCPKTLRNGPCGGVRADGKCEVKPEMDCVWVQAWDRAETMPVYGDDIGHIQPPLDHRLKGSSAWLNWLDGRGVPDHG